MKNVMQHNLTSLLLSILLLLGGCTTPSNPENEALFLLPTEANQKNEKFQSLEFESFPLDSVESSYMGYLEMDNDTIYLIDHKFCWVFKFTTDGKLADRVLGLGEGPKEYTTGSIEGYCRLLGNRWMFLDPGNGFNYFNGTFDRGNRITINKGNDRENKFYGNPHVYTIDYHSLKMKQMGDYIYYNVNAGQRMTSDYMLKPETYYRNVHILAKTNMTSGKVEAMIGGYPLFYDRRHYLFQDVLFDIDQQKQQFLVSYNADPLIYCYDKDYKPLYSFGWPGKDMDADYRSLSVDILMKDRDVIRAKYSFYHNLKYIEELGLLFRPYTRKLESKHDGLQIYQGQTLIADVDVPKNFIILGYSAPYVYGAINLDGIRESIDIYRFKL